MASKNHPATAAENPGGTDLESHGLHYEIEAGSFLADFPQTVERWGIGQRLADISIEGDWLERAYAAANISMEHLRKDQYDLKPGIIAARAFFYRDVFCLEEVKLRALKRFRTYWPKPAHTFAALENLESHGYDSRKLAMLEPMIMTRPVDIAAIEGVFRKSGFSKAKSRQTLCNNPTAFHFNPRSLDQKLKYIKSLGLTPQILVPKSPRILNNSQEKIGANAAFFDAFTYMTDDMVTTSPELLSISEKSREEILKIRTFCDENDIDPDKVIKNVGVTTYDKIVARYQLLADAGLDAGGVLERFRHVTYSTEKLQKRLDRVDRYLRFADFDEADRREYMRRNPQILSSPNARLRYLARAISTILRVVPSADLDLTTMLRLEIAVNRAGPELVFRSLKSGQSYGSTKEYVYSLVRASKERGGRGKKVRDYGAYAIKLKSLQREMQ